MTWMPRREHGPALTVLLKARDDTQEVSPVAGEQRAAGTCPRGPRRQQLHLRGGDTDAAARQHRVHHRLDERHVDHPDLARQPQGLESVGARL